MYTNLFCHKIQTVQLIKTIYTSILTAEYMRFFAVGDINYLQKCPPFESRLTSGIKMCIFSGLYDKNHPVKESTRTQIRAPLSDRAGAPTSPTYMEKDLSLGIGPWWPSGRWRRGTLARREIRLCVRH